MSQDTEVLVTTKVVAADWRLVMDADQIRRAITRIAHEVLERNRGPQKLAVVGIRTRGENIAARLVKEIAELEGVTVPLGAVDITLYRDDLMQLAQQPLVRNTDLPFNLEKHAILLVDDVLFTGRTVRSALDAVIDFGRPISVQLAVLCDRGHRELPIRADFVGKNLPTARNEVVEVLLNEKDGSEGVYIRNKKKAT